jgi:hypothetical protein
MKWNGIGWNAMESDGRGGMELNEMQWDAMEWNRMESDGIE